ncbi:MAG TPA: DUF4142 domain-containing protein [Catenuloplanes sp.]|jgi:predicted outer membrane protein
MAAPGPGGVEVPENPAVDTPSGPLTAADRDFVTKVRLAGLWEMPAGQMAVEKGSNKRVVEIGEMIAAQHGKLDQLARDAAKKLRMGLPNEPNADQQVWLGEMQRASGPEFDQVFVDRLRAAHGKIFPAIANIRSGTRNDVVRKLAQETNQFVLTHLTLLESTGLVDYGSLPRPPDPGTQAATKPTVDSPLLAAAQASGNAGGANGSIIWVVLIAALVAGVMSAIRLLRPR